MRTRARQYSVVEAYEPQAQVPPPPTDKTPILKQICLYDYRATNMPGYAPCSVLNPLAEPYIAQLDRLCAAEDQDAWKIQGALRWLAGMETQGRPCEEGALSFLDPIINRKVDTEAEWHTIDDFPPTSHEAINCYAHSIAAYVYFRKYMASAGELRVVVDDSRDRFPRREHQTRADDQQENITHAARHATHCAAGGFVSPAVLMVGFALKTLVKHVSVAVDVPLDLRHLKQYRPLWRAIEQWTGALNEVRSREPRKSHQVLLQNQCGSAGCTAVGPCRFSGPRLRSCKCRGVAAPHYCSKECQDQDWARHQASCMSSGVFTPPAAMKERYELVYGDFIAMSKLSDPIVRVEVMDKVMDEDELKRQDPMDGTVLNMFELPCPFGTPGRWVQYALKRYE